MALAALIGGIAAPACRSATEIRFEITTDAACSDVRGTAVTVGVLGAGGGIEDRPVSSTSSLCRADGTLGALVVVPSGANDEQVAVKVVTGVKTDPETCTAPAYGPGCIVARRALRFLPHTPLTVPVTMSTSCAGISCDPTTTCYQGACDPATIPDPAVCRGTGCPDSTLFGPPEGGTPALACDLTGAQPGAPWPMQGYCAAHRARSALSGPAATPRVVWRDAVRARPTLSPLIDSRGFIYVTTTDDTILVRDADDRPQWTFASLDPPIVDAGALGVDGTLYVPQRRSIAAVTPAGSAKWTQPYPVGNGVAGPLTLSSYGTVVLHDTATNVLALSDAGTQATLAWSFDAQFGLTYDLVAVGSSGDVFFSTDHGNVVALDTRGSPRWDNLFAGVTSDTMAIAPDGSLRIESGGNGNALNAITPGGAGRWNMALPAAEDFDLAIADDGTTVLGLEDGLLHAWDGQGQPSWTAPGGPFGSPSIGADGTIYVCGGSTLYAFTSAGAPLWSLPIGVTGTPAVVRAPSIGTGNALYLTAASGELIKVGP